MGTVSKNAEFYADFESKKKDTKNSSQKKLSLKKVICKKVTENGVFDFYYCMKNISAYNFFGVNCFAVFSTESNSASTLRFMKPIPNFKKRKFCLY
jgi:hypothetical protein